MNDHQSSTRWWDLLAALCLVVAVLTVATRLTVTRWTRDLEYIQYLTVLGLVLGLALGQSRFPAAITRLFAVAYTLFTIPWQLTLMQAPAPAWGERLMNLAGRLAVSAGQLIHGQPVDDSILFITLMAILFWLLGLSAGYSLTRYGNVWVSLIPSGIALFVIDHFDPIQPAWGRIVGIFLFFSLLLIMRVTFLRYHAEWIQRGITQAPEAGSDLARAGLIVVVIVVLMAWSVPALAASSDTARNFWENITRPWEDLKDRFSDAVVSLRGTIGVVSNFYGDQLALGTATNLSSDLVFTVEASGPPPEGYRFYWRARTYDIYTTSEGWLSDLTSEYKFDPTQERTQFAFPAWEGTQEYQFRFLPQVNLLSTLYTADLPIWVNRTADLVYGYVPNGSFDIFTIVADPALHAGEQYTSLSMIGVPSSTDLQASGADYPSWVTGRYLQLPDSYSPKVQALAQQITAGLDNPYDKTQAITQYLRSNISYDTKVGSPPDGIDPIEWFLFDLKQGYCNYFATAEVLMLRSVGIPARLVAGFAQGEADSEKSAYTVRQKDAHAWPEVYFNGFGWVEFEPTVSQPERIFPSGLVGADAAGNSSTQLPDALFRIDEGQNGVRPDPQGQHLSQDVLQAPTETVKRSPLPIVLLAVAGLVALVALTWWALRTRFKLPAFPVFLEGSLVRQGRSVPAWLRHWARLSGLTPIQKAYTAINRSLLILGVAVPVSATPQERMGLLSRDLPPLEDAARQVTHEYQQEIYGNEAADAGRVEHFGGQMQWSALRERLKRLLSRRPR